MTPAARFVPAAPALLPAVRLKLRRCGRLVRAAASLAIWESEQGGGPMVGTGCASRCCRANEAAKAINFDTETTEFPRCFTEKILLVSSNNAVDIAQTRPARKPELFFSVELREHSVDSVLKT